MLLKDYKDYYDERFASDLADKIGEHAPSFDLAGFVSYVSDALDGKEYTARMGVFVDAFDRYLPAYPDTLRIFSEMLGPELTSFAVMYDRGAWLAPVGKYVKAHCAAEPEYFEQSVDFIRELTKRYTGEFAMRPLIQAFPERTLAVLLEWSRSDSPFVRRCASECMRVRLPWAKKLTAAVEHFDLYTQVLDNLRHDSDPYVQRSVGNNLNDLFQYDAEKARSIVGRWQADGPSKATRKIIRHGTRTVRKAERKASERKREAP